MLARVCWVSDLKLGLFRDGKRVLGPSTPAIWEEDLHVLVVSEECRDDLSLLSEALSRLLERQDLELPIKLLLRELGSLDPEEHQIESALQELCVDKQQYEEARAQWQGDLGHVIRLLRPLVTVYRSDEAAKHLAELTTEDEVIQFLDLLQEPELDGRNLVAEAYQAADGAWFAQLLHRQIGDRLSLRVWNATLVQLGETQLVNREAEVQFSANLQDALPVLRSLIAGLIARKLQLGPFPTLYAQINEVSCPADLVETTWQVEFRDVIHTIRNLIDQWGAPDDVLTALREADSPEGLAQRLRNLGIEVDRDPVEVARHNKELFEATLSRLQQMGLAWTLTKSVGDADIWEEFAERSLGFLRSKLETEAYYACWSNDDVYQLARELPRQTGTQLFWQAVDESCTVEDAASRLNLSAADLAQATTRLEQVRQEARRRARLIPVCGDEFDSTDDSLTGLWIHICKNLPDVALKSLGGADLRRLEHLAPVKKKQPGDPRGNAIRPAGARNSRRIASNRLEQLVGLAGEIHAFRVLRQQYGANTVSSSCWLSANSFKVFPENRANDGYGCDFIIRLGRQTYYIEVKASEGDDDSFILGSSEIRLAMRLAKKPQRAARFVILRVANALSNSPSCQVLPNPYDPRYASHFSIQEANARVRYTRLHA